MTPNQKSSLSITQAKPADLALILALQKEAYLSEGLLYHNFALQPLTETLTQALEEFPRQVILKAESRGQLLGSVRALEKQGTVYIGKLMVRPAWQNRGLGRYLLQTIENLFAGSRYALFTGAKSQKNIALYLNSGYIPYKETTDATGFRFLHLEKRK